MIADDFYLQGRSPFQVARALRDEFSWLKKTRSELIARTETLAVTSEGQHMVFEASGVRFRRWLTMRDGRERPEHREAHGQIREIDEPFDVGGVKLVSPGIPAPGSGGAKAVSMIVNCRCDELPIVLGDQQFRDSTVWDGATDPEEFARLREAA